MEQRTCHGCDNQFEVGPRDRNPRKWCSEKCRVWCHNHPGQRRDTTPRSCRQCGGSLGHRQASALYCSGLCRGRAQHADHERTYPRQAQCEWCDSEYQQQRGNHRHCSTRCSMAQYRRDNPEKFIIPPEYRKAFDQRRRAQKKNNGNHELIVADEVYSRDNWCCHICSGTVDPNKAWPDPMSASVDHVHPLSKGGEHSYANVRCSHLRCNVAKGNRIEAPTPGV